jgi:hypothetical protein
MRIVNVRSHEVIKCVISLKTLSNIKILFEKMKYFLKDLTVNIKRGIRYTYHERLKSQNAFH